MCTSLTKTRVLVPSGWVLGCEPTKAQSASLRGRWTMREEDMRPAFESDRDVIQGCRAGDAGAWQSLLNRYERLVFSIPRRYGLSREDADDITQLTFTILIQSIGKLPDDSNLGAWLATVARRHTWRLFNRSRREGASEYTDSSEATPLLPNSATEDMAQWELTEWLHHGLSLVGEPCRDLLHALYLEPAQPSYAVVAARMGMAVGSVGPTRIRCLKRVKEVLDE
jgi:RNA polymerase sigma factor (sigma-70 family)